MRTVIALAALALFNLTVFDFSSEANAAGLCICFDASHNATSRKCNVENALACKAQCNAAYFSFGSSPSCDVIVVDPTPQGQVRVHTLTAEFWTDTGIDIQLGEIYTVTVVSEDSWQTNKYWINNGPGGHPHYIAGPNYVVPGGPEGALVGHIGGNSAFHIGRSGTTQAGQSGRLYLGPNDDPAGKFDNIGFAIVSIVKNP